MHTPQLEPPDNFRPHHKLLTHQDINHANEEFWSKQQILMHSRTSDESLLNLALADLQSEHDRGVPTRARKTIEKAFDDIEMVRKQVHTRFSQMGGRTRKHDVLQIMINGFVAANPNISEKDLLSRLEKEIGEGTIESIKFEADCLAGDAPLIRYVDDNGKEKTASVRGLKDRLSRAKKEINSR
jgi:hypothetical protein